MEAETIVAEPVERDEEKPSTIRTSEGKKHDPVGNVRSTETFPAYTAPVPAAPESGREDAVMVSRKHREEKTIMKDENHHMTNANHPTVNPAYTAPAPAAPESGREDAVMVSRKHQEEKTIMKNESHHMTNANHPTISPTYTAADSVTAESSQEAETAYTQLVEETRVRRDAITERGATPPVVVVAGGSGTGKSSLVSKLAGTPGIARSDFNRPTTRVVQAIVQDAADATYLRKVSGLGAGEIKVTACDTFRFPGLVLLDTPDTDSVENKSYAPVLGKALEQADVLICLFDVRDPKRMDNLDSLKKTVETFPFKDVIIALNHCDTVSAGELRGTVVPHFQEHLAKAWGNGGRFPRIFTLSCMEGDTRFEKDFDALCYHLSKIASIDVKALRGERIKVMENRSAEKIRDGLRRQGDWSAISEEIRVFEKEVVQAVYRQMARALPVGGELYQEVKRRTADLWWGPVGIYLSIARFFCFPLSRGFFTAVHGLVAPQSARERGERKLAEAFEGIDWKEIDSDLNEKWHRIGDTLVGKFGMAPSLREIGGAIDREKTSVMAKKIWELETAHAAESTAEKASWLPLQIIANGFLFAFGIVTVARLLVAYFYSGYLLPTNFLEMSLAIALLLWLLPAWLIQGWQSILLRGIRKRMEKRLVKVFPDEPLVRIRNVTDRNAKIVAGLVSPIDD